MENTKVIVITGSSSGFGYLTAKTLAKNGFRVYATMRNIQGKNAENANALNHWAKENKAYLQTVELDVTDEQSVLAGIKNIVNTEGKVDVLINNAGGGGPALFESYTLEEFKHHFDVNVFGAFSVTKAVLPCMRENKKGLLIYVSSVLGRTTLPFFSAYCASKSALEALAQTLRYELSIVGIDSIIIEPGTFPTTDIVKNMREYIPKLGTIPKEYNEIGLNFPKRVTRHYEKLIENNNAPDPQLIGDTILKLIQTSQGKRPFRTVIDPLSSYSIEPLNEFTDTLHRKILESMSLGNMFSVPEDG